MNTCPLVLVRSYHASHLGVQHMTEDTLSTSNPCLAVLLDQPRAGVGVTFLILELGPFHVQGDHPLPSILNFLRRYADEYKSRAPIFTLYLARSRAYTLELLNTTLIGNGCVPREKSFHLLSICHDQRICC